MADVESSFIRGNLLVGEVINWAEDGWNYRRHSERRFHCVGYYQSLDVHILRLGVVKYVFGRFIINLLLDNSTSICTVAGLARSDLQT